MTPQRTADAQARSVERQIEIAAPVNAVWKALTDAEELIRWFPLEARVTAGPGGAIWMLWDASEKVDDRIEVWEPERHLRSVGRAGSWASVATDYYLQGKGGGTVLRVVSSGFGADGASDDIVQGFGTGWDFELRGLRHYLERHLGIDRIPAWARTRHSLGYDRAWARLTGPGGFFGEPGLPSPGVGQRFAFTTSSGDLFEGEVMLRQPPYQFAATIDGWNDALFRAHQYGGTVMAWLSTYGVPEERVRGLERRWQESLDRLFPVS